MTTFDSDLAEVKAASAAYTAIMMELANRETNTFTADHTADDEAWLASLNVEADADELAPVECLQDTTGDDDGWDDEGRWELGPEDPEIDYAVLMSESWTLAPGAEADYEHCPGLIG